MYASIKWKLPQIATVSKLTQPCCPVTCRVDVYWVSGMVCSEIGL